MNEFWNDLRLSLRALVKQPGFTAVTVLTLALGIGPNTAIFSMINSVLLRPYPYKDEASIVRLWSMNQEQSIFGEDLSYPDYADLRQRNQVFAEMAVIDQGRFNLGISATPEPVIGARVSQSLFSLIGAQAELGRVFQPDEDRPGGPPVVVLGHDLWTRSFGSSREAVGQTVHINGRAHTVVGVLAPRVQFPDEADLWIPLAEDPARARRENRDLITLARLKPGIGVPQALASLDPLALQFEKENPETNKGWGFWVMTLRESRVNRYKPLLAILSGVVFFVLLLACANVGNLILQRAQITEREHSLRLALGAGRGALVRRLLAESVLLALAGSLLGLLLTSWLLRLVVSSLPFDLPAYMSFDIDLPVFGFMAVIAVLVAILCGLLPALRFSQPHLIRSLVDAGSKSTGSLRHRRMRNTLVGFQVALSLILLIGAVLMVRSFQKLQDVDAGFEVEHAASFSVTLPQDRYDTDEKRAAFYRMATERLAALPGVRAVGAASFLPMRGAFDTRYILEGQAAADQERNPPAGLQLVSGSYFQALGIPIVKGQVFDPRRAGGGLQEAIVGAHTAEKLWPGQEPVGKRLRLSFTETDQWWTVVGVAGDVRRQGLNREIGLDVYLPYEQLPTGSMSFFVRTEGDPLQVAAPVRQALQSIAPEATVDDVQTLDETLYWAAWSQRLSSYLFSIFAVISLVLAAVGVYGSTSYSTAQRTREIGIRMALGADRQEVVRMVVRQEMVTIGVGLVAGLIGAFAVSQLLSSLLFGVSSMDPLTFAAVPLLMALIAVASVYLPGRRATRVSPTVALRYE